MKSNINFICFLRIILNILPRGGFILCKILGILFPKLRSFDLEVKFKKVAVLKVDFRESVYFPIIKNSFYQHQISEDVVVRYLTSPEDVVIDAGANIGWMTLQFSQAVEGGGAVHAFEPNPKIYALLCRNLKNSNNVKALQVGLSNISGNSTFLVSKRSDLSKIVDDQIENTIKIRTLTIDQYVADLALKPTILKIDVEGHDVKVIEGAAATIAKCEPLIFFEALANKDLHQILKLLPPSFNVYRIHNPHPFDKISGVEATNNYVAISTGMRGEMICSLSENGFLSRVKR